jgi:hypothetical protein
MIDQYRKSSHSGTTVGSDCVEVGLVSGDEAAAETVQV